MPPAAPPPPPPTASAASVAASTTTSSTNEGGAPSSNRKRLTMGLVGCLLVAGAIIAGVLGSAARNKKASSKADPTVLVQFDNVLESLVGINTMPSVPAGVNGTITEPVMPGDPSAAAATPTTPTTNKEGTTTTNTNTNTNSALNNALEGLKEAITGTASAPPGSVSSGGWRGIDGARNTICYPINGTEVVTMSGPKSPCTVIVLTRSSMEPYNIRQQMNISTTKIFIGNPIDMPALNATNKIERLFYVAPGGRLDVRFVQMYRGSGRLLDNGRLKLSVGSVAYIDLGASFTATGCLFREQRQTVTQFLEDVPKILTHRSRNFGGVIFVVGGNVFISGSTFVRFRYLGNPIINSAQVGRDILLLAGNLVLTGVYNLNANLFANNVVAGNTLAVLGGTAVWTGGTTANAAGAQAQWGAGIQMFVGGGVLVDTGFSYLSANGALMRGAFGLFSVGGGVHIQTGYMQTRAWGVGSINNAGQTFSVGGGIHQMVGAGIATTSIANVFNGVGGKSFVGSGQIRMVGLGQARSSVAQTQYGAGLVYYNGAGTTLMVYNEQVSCQVARAQFCAGNDIFLGAGWHSSINTTRYAAQLVNAFYGAGNQIFVGAGGAVMIRNTAITFRGWGYSSTNFTVTVAGTGVTRRQASENIVITKNGVTRLAFQPSPKARRRQMQEQGLTQEYEGGVVEGGEEATLYGGAGEDQSQPSLFSALTGGAYSDPEGESKLVVIQSEFKDGKRGSFVIQEPKAFAGKELKDVWGGLAQLLAEGVVEQDKGEMEWTKGQIYVNNTKCFVCAVGPGLTAEHVVGPSTCHVSDECGGDSPEAAFASAQEVVSKAAAVAVAGGEKDVKPFDLSFPGMGGFMKSRLGRRLQSGEIKLPDVWLLWHEMVVYCRTTDPAMGVEGLGKAECLSEGYVKEVVKAFLQAEGGYKSDDYQIAVASATVHDVVRPFVTEPLQQAMTPEWNAECEGWTKFNIYITATEPSVEEPLIQEWNAILKDPSDLQTTLLENSDPAAKIKPCSITLRRMGAAKYPSLQNMKGFKPMTTSGLSLVGPSLTVASEKAIAPVTQLVEGETYKLYVQNFMKGSKININLVQGLSGMGPVVATIASFNDDATGMEELSWTAPEGIAKGPNGLSRHYLTASVDNLPAFFTNSQAFQFVPADAASKGD